MIEIKKKLEPIRFRDRSNLVFVNISILICQKSADLTALTFF